MFFVFVFLCWPVSKQFKKKLRVPDCSPHDKTHTIHIYSIKGNTDKRNNYLHYASCSHLLLLNDAASYGSEGDRFVWKTSSNDHNYSFFFSVHWLVRFQSMLCMVCLYVWSNNYTGHIWKAFLWCDRANAFSHYWLQCRERRTGHTWKTFQMWFVFA